MRLPWLGIVFFFCIPPHPQAWAESFAIDSYHSEVMVGVDAVLRIHEKLDLDFSEPRHGLVRKIPFRYQVPWQGSYYQTLVYGVSVQKYPFKVSHSGDYVIIKVGDPNHFVSGRVHYDIQYSVFNAIRVVHGLAELYWNLVGLDWDVPIRAGTFQLFFDRPIEFASKDYAVFTGPRGARLSNVNVTQTAQSLFIETTAHLNPHEGVTADVRMPESYFQKVGWILKGRIFFLTRPYVATPLLVWLLMHVLWSFFKRRERAVSVVQFRPPPGMTPAEAGILIDDQTNHRDLIALIYYWACNGNLRIEESEPSGIIFKTKEHRLVKLKPLPPEVKKFESTLFSGLFLNGSEVKVSSLGESFFHCFKTAIQELDEAIKEQGFYKRGSRELGKVLSLFTVAFLVGYFYFFEDQYDLLEFLISDAIAGVIIFYYSRIMPCKSETGERKLQLVKGFYEFIERAEAPILKRMLDKEPDYFNQTLPFAVAFGLGGKWAEKFDGLLVQPPTWYVGNGTLDMRHFGEGLDASLSQLTRVTTPPASQGGSGFSVSGGGGSSGFSGGGFGGGGGSSW